jgi:hypothetical protein
MLSDGASIFSPGVLWRSIVATRLVQRPVVVIPAWHLDADLGFSSLGEHDGGARGGRQGKVHGRRDDGYRLFEFASPITVSQRGWLGWVLASNCITIQRQHYSALAGCSPGPSTSDDNAALTRFLRRAATDPLGHTVLILGEGTFGRSQREVAADRDRTRRSTGHGGESAAVGGEAFPVLGPQPILFGHMPAAARRFMEPALFAAIDAQHAYPAATPTNPSEPVLGPRVPPGTAPSNPLRKAA